MPVSLPSEFLVMGIAFLALFPVLIVSISLLGFIHLGHRSSIRGLGTHIGGQWSRPVELTHMLGSQAGRSAGKGEVDKAPGWHAGMAC